MATTDFYCTSCQHRIEDICSIERRTSGPYSHAVGQVGGTVWRAWRGSASWHAVVSSGPTSRRGTRRYVATKGIWTWWTLVARTRLLFRFVAARAVLIRGHLSQNSNDDSTKNKNEWSFKSSISLRND